MSKLKRIAFKLGLAKYPTTNKERQIEAARIKAAIEKLEAEKLLEESLKDDAVETPKSTKPRRKRRAAKKA